MFRPMGLVLPLEVAAVVALVVVALRRRAPTDAGLDVPERIREALIAVRLPERVASVLATECAVFYYALAAWRRRPFAPAGARPFSYHRRNAYAATLYAFVGVAFVEMAVVDLLVRVRHPTAANVLFVVDVLAAIWILGLARSVQLRPVLLSRDTLVVRNGLAATVDVPLSTASIEVGRVRAPAKGTPGYWRAALGQPNVLVTLSEPATVRRAYGRPRTVERIGLVLDDPAGFASAWNAAVPAVGAR